MGRLLRKKLFLIFTTIIFCIGMLGAINVSKESDNISREGGKYYSKPGKLKSRVIKYGDFISMKNRRGNYFGGDKVLFSKRKGARIRRISLVTYRVMGKKHGSIVKFGDKIVLIPFDKNARFPLKGKGIKYVLIVQNPNSKGDRSPVRDFARIELKKQDGKVFMVNRDTVLTIAIVRQRQKPKAMNVVTKSVPVSVEKRLVKPQAMNAVVRPSLSRKSANRGTEDHRNRINQSKDYFFQDKVVPEREMAYAVKPVKGGVNYYTLLGVSRDATRQAIIIASKKLLQQINPSKSGFRQESKAMEALKYVNNAKRILANKYHSNLYDLYLKTGEVAEENTSDFVLKIDKGTLKLLKRKLQSIK